MMDNIRFGIIGMGVQGTLYAHILTGTQAPDRMLIPKPEGCVLGAVCSRSEQTGALAKKLGVAWVRDWRELLESDLCDAVILTVPHFLHHEIAIAAMKSGKHVLCEKPAGVRASDVAQMMEVHQHCPGITLGMLLNQRTNPLFSQLKSIVESGALGSLRRSNWIINTNWRPDSYYTSAPWRGTWGGEGGGLLVNQLPHYLDLWIYLCGMPERVYAMNRYGAYRSISVENDVSALVEYPGGATGVFVASGHDPLGTDRLEMDFERGKIILTDSRNAEIHYFSKPEPLWNQEISHIQMAHLARQPEHHDTTELHSTPVYGMDHAALMENFASHILNGTPLIATAQDGLNQVRLANAMQLSGWQQKMVSIPCDEEEFDRELAQRIKSEPNP